MNPLTAPFFSLFSVSFYRRVVRSNLGHGILYLFYLALLATLFSLVIFCVRALPIADQFVEWARGELPPITFDKGGVSLPVKMPFTLVHPEFGPLVTFDTTKTEITLEAMGEVPAFVTSQKLYMKQRENEVRVYDLTQNEKVRTEPLVVDSETIRNFYGAAKVWVLAFGMVFFFIFFLIWKLLAAVFYSWIGLLINFARHPKLSYGAILNASFFTLTPWTLVQLLGFVLAPVASIPFPLLGSLFVTSVYLFLAVKLTQEEELTPGPGPPELPPAA